MGYPFLFCLYLSSVTITGYVFIKRQVADIAVEYADKLVEELKKE